VRVRMGARKAKKSNTDIIMREREIDMMNS